MALTGFNIDDQSITDFTGMLDGGNAASPNDPFITGYAFVRFTHVPPWVDAQFGGGKVKKFLESNFKGLSGLNDMDMDSDGVTTGFNANMFDVAKGIQKGNNEFTLKFQEYSGSPVRSIFQYWVSGIRDPETGIATYVANSPGGKYGAVHHTADMLYIVTRPDAHNIEGNNIEFAGFWTNVMPKKIPLQHLNYTQGQRDAVEIDIPFTGNFHMSASVDAFAKKILESSRFNFRALGDFKRAGRSAM
jgi:hypothetical protein